MNHKTTPGPATVTTGRFPISDTPDYSILHHGTAAAPVIVNQTDTAAAGILDEFQKIAQEDVQASQR